MYGTDERVMKVGKAPLKREQRGPGHLPLCLVLPATHVLLLDLEPQRPLLYKGPSSDAMGGSQV